MSRRPQLKRNYSPSFPRSPFAELGGSARGRRNLSLSYSMQNHTNLLQQNLVRNPKFYRLSLVRFPRYPGNTHVVAVAAGRD
jgi:hypothetical protein